jgi:hypothetical protein
MSRKGNNNDEMEEEAFRRVKRERLNANDNAPEDHQDSSSRRIIRSEFLKLKSLINGIFPISFSLFILIIIISQQQIQTNPSYSFGGTEKKDDLMNTDSDKFDSILHEFDKLHDQVKRPREQVADAEALLDLTRTLLGSVKSLANEGVTPSQFVSSLLKHYAHPPNTSIDWQKLGIAVSPIFLTVHGSSTMLVSFLLSIFLTSIFIPFFFRHLTVFSLFEGLVQWKIS